MNIKELYNRAVIKGRDIHDEYLYKAGYKVVVTIERQGDKKLVINTSGIRGRVYIDDFDEEKISKFINRPLRDIRVALKKGKRYADSDVKVSFEFINPLKKDNVFKITRWEPMYPKVENKQLSKSQRKKANKRNRLQQSLGKSV